MTNKEKFRDVLEDFALAQVIWGLDKNGEPVPVYSSFTNMTSTERLQWLNEEYKEPEICVDWSKVEVDTPIFVRNGEDEMWLPRYFAKYEAGLIYAWNVGKASWTSAPNSFSYWKYARLVKE